MKDSTLAIYGGKPVIPEGMVKNWPPIDDTDRAMVLASLNGDQHAFGPNCAAFTEEFAAWNGNRHAIFTNSGTSALHMSLVACGIGAQWIIYEQDACNVSELQSARISIENIKSAGLI